MMHVSAQVFLPQNEKFKKMVYAFFNDDDDDDYIVNEDETEAKLAKTYAISFCIARAFKVAGCMPLIEKL